MSTKFSVRPAPRKRPWLCKRSPPCLPPPIQPLKLLATFRLKKIAPPPIGQQWSGSFSIANLIPSTLYGGAWTDGVNFFQLEFTYPAPPGGVDTRANWWLGPDTDMGRFARHNLQLPPPMAYKAGSPTATVDQWVGQLLVTS